MTIGGRSVDLFTALAFRWACFRAQVSTRRMKRTLAEFAVGFAIGATAAVAGCTALVG